MSDIAGFTGGAIWGFGWAVEGLPTVIWRVTGPRTLPRASSGSRSAAAVLIRLAANAAVGAWSPDGVALGRAAFAVKEARGSWEGKPYSIDGCRSG